MDSYAYDYGGYAAADASATATTVGVGAAAAACCFQIVFVALVVGCCFLLDSVGIWLARTRRAVSQHSALESCCADRIA